MNGNTKLSVCEIMCSSDVYLVVGIGRCFYNKVHTAYLSVILTHLLKSSISSSKVS